MGYSRAALASEPHVARALVDRYDGEIISQHRVASVWAYVAQAVMTFGVESRLLTRTVASSPTTLGNTKLAGGAGRTVETAAPTRTNGARVLMPRRIPPRRCFSDGRPCDGRARCPATDGVPPRAGVHLPGCGRRPRGHSTPVIGNLNRRAWPIELQRYVDAAGFCNDAVVQRGRRPQPGRCTPARGGTPSVAGHRARPSQGRPSEKHSLGGSGSLRRRGVGEIAVDGHRSQSGAPARQIRAPKSSSA